MCNWRFRTMYVLLKKNMTSRNLKRSLQNFQKILKKCFLGITRLCPNLQQYNFVLPVHLSYNKRLFIMWKDQASFHFMERLSVFSYHGKTFNTTGTSECINNKWRSEPCHNKNPYAKGWVYLARWTNSSIYLFFNPLDFGDKF